MPPFLAPSASGWVTFGGLCRLKRKGILSIRNPSELFGIFAAFLKRWNLGRFAFSPCFVRPSLPGDLDGGFFCVVGVDVMENEHVERNGALA